ncbi:hypothetical protein ASPVEDRAFT_81137 [Aspergillus versicolor CBS 583.65]|uniref:O-methyltransferase domain-containing protein n=1 Tax=Aspergillus versicolor CBS 583.65 TaxID=1036611 RepID=A0A1L9PDJ6_ASPVE|nr:uncharacterized protein ASPVEDRAFT_81137 [Aspergillus versicolor CBS 583.65]OJI99524.1 hypothetical protein ASPVEDRAFT_81137 [Aspergillus versicolor CBS 583.65]
MDRTGSASFLRQLVLQAQILANLQWLCEFQVLACIPLDGEVAFEEVAGISNVPVDHLQRVVRLMTTAGFLREQTSGHVSHTALSASFVTEPDLLDAALFLAQVAVPAALKMSHTAHQPAPYNHDQLSAVHFDPSQPKTHRQFAAYLAHGILDEPSAIDEVLRLIDWDGIGAATVVDVHPQSTATVAKLAALAPALQFVIQTSSPNNGHSGLMAGSDGGMGGPSWMTSHLPSSISSRVTVQTRPAAASQTVLGAAIYILRIPSPSSALSWATIRSQTILELQAHLQVLRAQSSSRLILTVLVIPPPGAVDQGTEAMVRVREMSLLQLTNERLPSKTEIIDLLTAIRDSAGGLVLTREIYAPASAATGLEVKYQVANERGR